MLINPKEGKKGEKRKRIDLNRNTSAIILKIKLLPSLTLE